MSIEQAQPFYGRIVGGKPVMDDPISFQRLKNSLEGQQIEIRLMKRGKERSGLQNKYYWGVLIKMISEFTGHSPEEVHEGLKQRFLIDHSDERLPRVRSTSSLTTVEFARYVDDCVQLAAEFGLIIPDPS